MAKKSIETIEVEEPTLYSPLTKEKVIIRHLPKTSPLSGNNPKHILYGGMAEGATRQYTVPQLRNGQLKDPLTTEEKDFLESYMGFEPNALSVHKRKDNFWSNYVVTLGKTDNVLDLSSPDDYIKYKILLLNDNLIAPNLDAVQNARKATYEYVIIREKEVLDNTSKKINSTMEAYKEFGKIESDISILRFICESYTKRAYSPTTKLVAFQDTINEFIQADAKLFLKMVKDPLLSTKVLLRDGITAGVISNRGGQLYMKADGTPLCDNGEPTLSVAATFLNKPKNQELKFIIESKVNEYKNN